jgi:isoprenylcysteine carboxyl methyltransferase (ICMT) family protein YpbQ
MSATYLERPAKVVLAIRLFYLVIAFGVAQVIMTVARHYDVRSPDFLILSKVLWYVACIYVLYELGKGKSWAQWLMVALFFASIPLAILPAFGVLTHNLWGASITFLQVGLYVAALFLLFDRRSLDWFDAEKHSRDQ